MGGLLVARYKSPKSQEMQLLLGDRQAGVGDTHPPTCPQLMLQTPKDHRTPYILAVGADPPKCPQGTEPYEIPSWKGPIRITESNSCLHTKNQTTNNTHLATETPPGQMPLPAQPTSYRRGT